MGVDGFLTCIKKTGQKFKWQQREENGAIWVMFYVREADTKVRLSKSIDECAEAVAPRPIHQSGLDALLTWDFIGLHLHHSQ
jgi:hypothetical protein